MPHVSPVPHITHVQYRSKKRDECTNDAESFLVANSTTDRHGRAALTLAQPQKRRALAKPVRESPWLTISATPPLPSPGMRRRPLQNAKVCKLPAASIQQPVLPPAPFGASPLLPECAAGHFKMRKCASSQQPVSSSQYPAASIRAAEDTCAGNWILTVYTFAHLHTFARSGGPLPKSREAPTANYQSQ